MTRGIDQRVNYTGLLTDIPRKTCDGIASAVAGTTTERLQHLLIDADWDALALDRERVRQMTAASPAGSMDQVHFLL
jgi:SRSO17 transposase